MRTARRTLYKFWYSQDLPAPSNKRVVQPRSSPPPAAVASHRRIDPTWPTVQGPVDESSERASHYDEGNRENNSSVTNVDFAQFLAKSQQDLSPNGKLPARSLGSFPRSGVYFPDDNMADRAAESERDWATFLAERIRQLAIKQQAGPRVEECTIVYSSLAGLSDSTSNRSRGLYTSTLGCQSIRMSLASCPPSPASPTPFVPCEGGVIFGRDSLDFVNFSSYTPAGLEIDNTLSYARHVAADSPAKSPDICRAHNTPNAPLLQRRVPRPANRVANLREQYLHASFMDMLEPMPNKCVGPFPDLSKPLTPGKPPGMYRQGAYKGVRELQPVTYQYESFSISSSVYSAQTVVHRLRDTDRTHRTNFQA